MKVGFNLLLWASAVEQIDADIIAPLKQVGYDGVEIPIFTSTPDDYAKLGRLLDELALERTALTVFPTVEQNPLSDDPAARKAAVDYLDWATACTEALGAKNLCGPLHSTLGHFSGAGPTETERSRMVDFHRAVGDIAAGRGVTIAVEALNRFECYALTTADDLARHLDLVGHPAIKAMYDTFHAHIEEKDVAAAIAAVAQHLTHVHISENDRGVPGTGQVQWAKTFAALKASGYDGFLTIEAFGRALPDLAAATRVWRDLFADPQDVWRDGLNMIRAGWSAA